MPESDVILEADGLRVVFFRRGDRYVHRVEFVDAATGEWQTALESLEGEPGDEWPPSPPFQQLHVERRTTGLIVFLIGMAGKTHWSAAVEVAADRKSITFDVAARVQLAPQRVGSEYLDASSDEAGLGRAVRFETKSTLRPDELRIESAAATQIPATIAWNYAILRS